MRAHSHARTQMHACAVGSLQGPVTMSQSTKWEVAVNEGLAAAGAATVPMITLADVLRPGVSIALLKVDTEGFERGVLAGLSPQLLASVHDRAQFETLEKLINGQAGPGAAAAGSGGGNVVDMAASWYPNDVKKAG